MTTAMKTQEAVRATLLARREALRTRLDRVSADTRREPEPLSTDSSDRAIQVGNDAVVDSIGLAAAEELRKVNDALRRLGAGRYGVCESCGAAIEPGRLAAVPYADRCLRCTPDT